MTGSVRNAIGSMLVSLLLQSNSGAQQRGADQIRFYPVAPREGEKLSAKLRRELAPGAQIQVEPQQIFALKSSGMEDLFVVPVMYQPHGDPGEPSQCGVYFLAAGGTSRYLPVVNVKLQPTDMCQEVVSAATVPHSGSPPRLIFLFGVNSGHGADNTLAYILNWTPVSRLYQVDTETSQWLNSQKGSRTIAGVRKLLAMRH